MSYTKSGLNTLFLVGTRQMADGRWQKEKKEFSRQGGYQGGVAIMSFELNFYTKNNTGAEKPCVLTRG
jgi:hypothetical protein